MIFSLLSLLLLSCNDYLDQKRELEKQDMHYAVSFTSFKKHSYEGGYSIFLYAQVDIWNKADTANTFNLNEISLKVGNHISDEIYIDSFMSTYITEEKILAQERISYKVYWTFIDVEPDFKNQDIEVMVD